MKLINVPADIVLVDPLTGEKGDTVSFRSYAFKVWLGDRRALEGTSELTSAEMGVRWAAVIEKFKGAKENVTLEDSDYRTLRKIVENPSFFMGNSLVEVQLIPFVLAVIEAKSS